MAIKSWPEDAVERITERKRDYMSDLAELAEVAAAANEFVDDLLSEVRLSDWPLQDSLVRLLDSLGCEVSAEALRERIAEVAE